MFKKLMQELVVVAVVVLVNGASFSAFSGELPDGKKDRQGFFLGLGVGGGFNNLNGGGVNENSGVLMGDIKIGGGLNEKMLLLYNGSFRYTKIKGVNFTFYNLPVALQWFFYENFYVRPGVGLSFSTASLSASGVTVSTKSKVSFGFDLAAGREFRIGRRFAVSPEAVYQFSHIRDTGPNGQAHSFGAKASLMWYF